MKVSKYINKYDYIGYFTKPINTWFFSNSEIEFILESLIKEKSIENNVDFSDEEYDDNINIEDNNYNYYELYKEALLKGDIKKDDDDPRVFEGNIIDEKTKQFVIDKYPEIKVIIDFSNEEYRWKPIEELFELSKKLISQNDDIIIFQPTLIHGDLITRPDAFVKIKSEINIIETKGTSTTKISHFFDIFFQSKVVEKAVKAIINKEGYKLYFNYFLCLVNYEKLKSKHISFILTNSFNPTKSFTSPKQNEDTSEDDYIKQKSRKKIGYNFDKKSEIEYNITFNNCTSGNFSDFPECKSKLQKNIIDIYESFNEVIDELRVVKKTQMDSYLKNKVEPFPTTFFPTWRDKGKYKNSSIWPLLRVYYGVNGFKNFLYSGNSTYQTLEKIIEYYEESQLSIKEIKEKIYFKDTANEWFNKDQDILILPAAVELFSKLKSKKVYFDFETINSAIRAFDDTTPFAQIVTQCSILINDGQNFDDAVCKNLLTDPFDIKLDFFKEIVDELYHGSDYSYVVYNITFERSRLFEFKKYINEKSYDEKIDTIIDNLFDLADFFNFTKNKQNIFLKKLYGYYSIKKVLPLIKEEYPDLFKQAKCVDYKSLEITDGLICQSATSKRFFNLLNEKEWNDLSNNLKLYCENDVRAMVAVEYYIDVIIKKHYQKG